MSYTPQVGDTVRLAGWDDELTVTVTAVGLERLLVIDSFGAEWSWPIDADWVKAEPLPDLQPVTRWAYVDKGGWPASLACNDKRNAASYGEYVCKVTYSDIERVDP